MDFVTFLFEHRDDRPAQFLNHGFEKRSVGIPGVHHHDVKEAPAIALAHPAQQAQSRRAFLLARAHWLEVQNHAQLRPAQLRIYLLVVILRLWELLALGVFAGDFPGQTILTTAVVAAELFVGIRTDDQQALDFVGFKGLAPFELAADPDPRPAQLGRIHPRADITKGVVADLLRVAHPPLPLGQFGFGL